jgi:uncharacterized membrane protein
VTTSEAGTTLAPPASYRFPATAAQSRQLELIAVGLLTVIAFALRFSQIHQSLLGDEVFTYHDVVGRSFGSVLTTVHAGGENSPPLFFVLAWASAKLGDPTVWIRLPSVLLGAATVPGVFALGRATVGRAAGLVGAAIMAASPFTLFYGVEARPYAAMAFFVVLSTLALLRAISTRSRWWWALYAAAAAAAAYTHYTCVFVVAVQAVWSLWVCRDRIRAPLIANALIVILYLPWLPHVRGKSLSVIGRLEPLTAHNVIIDLPRGVAGYPYASLRAIPTYLGLVAIGACVLLGLVRLARDRSATRTGGPLRRGLGLLTALALATPIGVLLYSLLGTDLWLARGLYASVPAAALVIGALLVRLPRPLAAMTIVVVLVTLIAGSVRATSHTYVRQPFRAVAAYLDRTAGPGDPIIYASIVGEPAISVQLHRQHPVITVADLVHPSAPIPPNARVYYVLDDTLAARLKITSVRLPGLQLVASKHYSGIFPTDLLTFRPAQKVP